MGISKNLNEILQKANTGGRQVGERKIGADGITREWSDRGNGKFNWVRVKTKTASTKPSGVKRASLLSDPDVVAKLKTNLENSSVDKLVGIASGSKNNAKLRLMAFAELESRGEDVSEIDMDNGRLGAIKTAMGKNKNTPTYEEDDVLYVDVDLDEEDKELDWQNTDQLKMKLKLPSQDKKMTKKHRILLDDYIHKLKIQQPNYRPPADEIFDLNRTYAYFLDEGAPFMIVSGGAGVGKTWNFKAVAKEYAGLKAFDPETDKPGDDDYDWVEAGEAGTVPQLLAILKEHNGKIIVFDDADKVLKEEDTLNILKKATNPSGVRMIGKESSNKNTSVPVFEFTGQILFLTNMSQYELTKDENMNAVYSRAIKKDIYFTKREQLSFMSRLRQDFEFTAPKRLADKDLDKDERNEVFKLISDNIDSIDPGKFNSRLMMEVIAKKRAIDKSNAKFDSDPIMSATFFGNKIDWKTEARDLLIKGGLSEKDKLERIQKAKDLLTL